MATPVLKTLDHKKAWGSPLNAPRSSADYTIDLVHLSRQTLGDRTLEIELLRLFHRQCEQIILKLNKMDGSMDRRARADLGHTLKGSASAVGAYAVAAAASLYEETVSATDYRKDSEDEALTRLIGAVEEASRSILRLLVE